MSRAPVRFRARYIRVLPLLAEPSSTVRIDITGLSSPANVEEEMERGAALARLIEVTLNAAFVAFTRDKKVC